MDELAYRDADVPTLAVPSGWTRTGADAAGHSNIALTSGQMTAGRSVELYTDDAGSGNRVVGHRRWVLNPFAAVMGNGRTADANAPYVQGPTDSRNSNPPWVSWPTAGWFPTQLQPRGRWSLCSGRRTASFRQATVTVRHIRGTAKPSHTWTVRLFRP